jgi:cytochrome c peroxidase
MPKPRPILFAVSGFAFIALAAALFAFWPRQVWNNDELAKLQSLWIGSLPPLPPDPSNAYGDDPRAAVLGQKLFFDARFSLTGDVACATCHLPDQNFQDGLPRAQGIGRTNRRTMPIAGTAYSPWQFWDGRKDSQWAQALGPLENPVEHGGNRTLFAHLIARYYREEYEALFGPLPDLARLPPNAGPVPDAEARSAWERLAESDRQAVTHIYANMGKAIAAYERLLLPGPARFDAYVEAALKNDRSAMQATLSQDEAAGLRLFISKAECIQCHNGPLFTDNHFHNTGIPVAAGLPEDTGRALGAKQVLADEFNCLSPYSDAGPDDCAELRYMVSEGEDLLRQFKPPSLRNVAGRPPYMHAGQFATLEEVLAHYNRAPAAPAGHTEIKPLDLTEAELRQIIAFLHALNSPVKTAPEWLRAPPLPEDPGGEN